MAKFNIIRQTWPQCEDQTIKDVIARDHREACENFDNLWNLQSLKLVGNSVLPISKIDCKMFTAEFCGVGYKFYVVKL